MSDHDHSMEEITFKDFYPLKQTTYEKDNLMIPFHPIAGEYIDYIGTMANGIIAISNYRFFVHRKELPFINLPLGLIDTVECQNLFTLVLLCKDAKTYSCSFATNDKCMEWQKRLIDSLKQSSKLSSSFALTFAAWCSSEKSCSESLSDEWFQGSVFDREVTRMAFNLNYEGRPWRICHANENYEICETYPRLHIVPSSISDDMIRDMAKYRSNSRFPSVVWRDMQTGLVMVRCSQPNVGLLWWRNSSDEAFIRSVGESCQLNPGLEQIPIVPDDAIVVDEPHKDLLLIDARSYAAATANRAKGGGVECNEYYPNANVVFMNLPNIHSIKRCFINLRNICTNSDDASWLSALESSKWLFHISNLLKSSLVVVDSIRVDHKSVLVHCSDGWDRTPQILSLAQIMLDPYYRTVQGFHDLVEREWLGFGHRFADRCGQGTCYYDNQNDRCPIFLQWVDCLHQLVKQFPCSFEFNMNFLIKLVDHTYSCLFGDFLFNSDKDRSTLSSQYRTTSVWTFLLDNKKLLNPLFRPTKKVLRPKCSLRDMHFWSQLYLQQTPPIMTASYLQEMNSCLDDDVVDEDDGYHGEVEVFRNACSNDVGVDSADNSGSEVGLGYNADAAERDEVVELIRDATETIETDTNVTLLNKKDHNYKNSDNFNCDDDSANTRSKVNLDINRLTLKAADDEDVSRNNKDRNSLDKQPSRKRSKSLGKNPIALSNLSNKANVSSLENVVNNNGGMGHKIRHSILRSGSPSSDECDELKTSGNKVITKNSIKLFLKQQQLNGDIADDFKTPLEYQQTSNHNDDTPFTTPVQECKGTIAAMERSSMNEAANKTDNCFNGDNFSQEEEVQPTSLNADCLEGILNKSRMNSGPARRKLESTNQPRVAQDEVSQRIRQLMDTDGLTVIPNALHTSLLQMKSAYSKKMKKMQRQLDYLKKLINVDGISASALIDCKDEVSSEGSADPPSNNSVASWELLNEGNNKVVLWVPDHLVTHCAGCEREFWVALRKHHCRSCGKVYCHDCSSYSMPCPHQNLLTPVRVCKRCFDE